MPSAAIAEAHPGDTIDIAPGRYFDCAVVRLDRLTIQGMGGEVTLTDKTCQEKAILVISGADVIVRDLTLTRARVNDKNGAGIRAEGRNLTVDHVRFINNEDGILAADTPGSTIRISNSEFRDNGRCVTQCAHALYAGRIDTLHVDHSIFSGTLIGHHIKSRAARTEVIESEIADGPDGTASYFLELPDGGDLLMLNNKLQKGPKATSKRVVLIGAESPGDPGSSQAASGNTLIDDGAGVEALVVNWGAANPVLSRNTLPAGVTPLTTSGAWLHWAHDRLYHAKESAFGFLGLARRGVHKIMSMI